MDYRPVPLLYERPSLDESLAGSRAFLASLDARRSVRRFSSEPVPWVNPSLDTRLTEAKSPARRVVGAAAPKPRTPSNWRDAT
jgi:hypothetical protein